MSTVTIGLLTVEDIGRTIRPVDGDALGVLARVAHHADETGAWTTVVVVADGAPRPVSFAASKRVVLGGSS